MKKSYIAAIGIGIISIVIALVLFNSYSIEYADIATAKKTGKKLQILASLDSLTEPKYDATSNIFTFIMKDEKQETARVIYNGAAPNNFKLAKYFVVKGEYRDTAFYASEIYTKCPSKYEADGMELE